MKNLSVIKKVLLGGQPCLFSFFHLVTIVIPRAVALL